MCVLPYLEKAALAPCLGCRSRSGEKKIDKRGAEEEVGCTLAATWVPKWKSWFKAVPVPPADLDEEVACREPYDTEEREEPLS